MGQSNNVQRSETVKTEMGERFCEQNVKLSRVREQNIGLSKI